MTQQSEYITPEVRSWLDKEFPIEKGEVLARDIKRWAIAIGDNNPIYYDQDFAKKTPYGGIIAPPLFYRLPFSKEEPLEELEPSGMSKGMGPVARVPVPLRGAMNGGREVEYFEPIRAGDVLTRTTKIVEVFEKKGRSGPLVFVVGESSYYNQKGQLCVKERDILIRTK